MYVSAEIKYDNTPDLNLPQVANIENGSALIGCIITTFLVYWTMMPLANIPSNP